MLEQVAGIKERRWWPPEVTYSEAAAQAGAKALETAGVSPDDIGLLIDTSVCRARLEPSSAVFVHNELGLPPSCLNFDLSNACLGFVNGMHLAGMMIDSVRSTTRSSWTPRVAARSRAHHRRLQDPSHRSHRHPVRLRDLTARIRAAGMVLGRATATRRATCSLGSGPRGD